MQTFLPFPDFEKTASCLDGQRLRNQPNECKVILRTLLGRIHGWRNHPAVRMWEGHEYWLCDYALAICYECRRRGYKGPLLEWFLDEMCALEESQPVPKWLCDERLHSSHRSNLLRKMPEHYTQFGWIERDDLPYFWPTKEIHEATTQSV